MIALAIDLLEHLTITLEYIDLISSSACAGKAFLSPALKTPCTYAYMFTTKSGSVSFQCNDFCCNTYAFTYFTTFQLKKQFVHVCHFKVFSCTNYNPNANILYHIRGFFTPLNFMNFTNKFSWISRIILDPWNVVEML